MLDDINTAITSQGGRWVKLRNRTDPHIDGTILTAVSRGKTFEGQPVLSRLSKEQRVEWVFTMQTAARDDAEDDGVRKFAANESAQRAIAEAVRAANSKLEPGGRLKLAVIADPQAEREQPTFKAKYEPPAPTSVNVADIFGDSSDDEEPF